MIKSGAVALGTSLFASSIALAQAGVPQQGGSADEPITGAAMRSSLPRSAGRKP
jgi:hypothetical protein